MEHGAGLAAAYDDDDKSVDKEVVGTEVQMLEGSPQHWGLGHALPYGELRL